MKNKRIKNLTSKLKKYKKRIDKLEARLEECEKSCCPTEEAADIEEVKEAETETTRIEPTSE